MSKARKVLVNIVLRCIYWYIWCVQFFDFVNLFHYQFVQKYILDQHLFSLVILSIILEVF